MLNLLRTIDIYGEEIKLKINNKNSIKTVFGGFLTIITALLITLTAWFLANDVVYRSRPVSYTDSSLYASAPEITITNENLPLIFRIQDGVTNIINNRRLFNLTITYYVVNKVNNLTIQTGNNIKLSNCSAKHFPNVTDLHILDTFMDGQCIDNQNLTLQGYWGDSYIKYLNVIFSLCDYTNFPDKCASETEIFNYIKANKVSAQLATIENIVKITNYTNPFIQYVGYIYRFMYPGATKVNNLAVSNNILKTDSDFFSSNFQEENFLSINEKQSDLGLGNKQIVTYNIFSSTQNYIYYRSYIKITQIFGALGSILQLLTLILFYLNMFVCKVAKYLIVYDNLYDSIALKTTKNSLFNLKKSPTINRNYNTIKIQPTVNNITVTKSPLYLENKVSKIDKNLKRLATISPSNVEFDIETAITKRKFINFKLHLLIKEKVKRIFNCKTNRAKCKSNFDIFEQLRLKAKNFFDFSFIIEKILQIDKLKEILLVQKENIEVFNILYQNYDQKQAISFSNIDDKIINNIEDVDKLKKFLNKINKDPAERKLQELLYTKYTTK